MKKLLPLLFTLVCLNAFAQRNPEDPYTSKAISFGPELLLPGKTAYNYGVGASLKVEYPFSDLISFTGAVRYAQLHYTVSEDIFGKFQDYKAIPVLVGAKFFLDPDLYADVEAGAAFGINYDKQKSLALSFTLGYIFPIKNSTGLDVGVRFDDWGRDRFRAVDLRVAYRIAWWNNTKK